MVVDIVQRVDDESPKKRARPTSLKIFLPFSVLKGNKVAEKASGLKKLLKKGHNISVEVCLESLNSYSNIIPSMSKARNSRIH